MRSLYLRIWLTVLAALALFALVSGWLVQRHVEQERVRLEESAQRRAEAWADLLERSLPPASAPLSEQARALSEWGERLRLPMALDDARGQRIAVTEAWRRREAEGLPIARRAWPSRLDDGRTLWIARLRPMQRGGPPHAGPGPAGMGEMPGHRMEPAWPWLPAPGSGVGLLVLVLLLFAAVAAGAWPVVRRLTRRLEALKAGVEAFGAGALHQRVSEDGRDEVAAVAASFNRAADRVQALLKSHQNLLANASHELRSPLARLKMAVSLMAEAPEPQRAALRREIDTNIAELDALVEEVLLASRLDAAQEALSLQTVDLLALAAEEAAQAHATLAVSLQASMVSVPEADRSESVGEAAGATALEHQRLSVAGDERLLRRALRNLLENARRYGAGEVELSVGLEPTRVAPGQAVAASPLWVFARVCDRGPGVPEAWRERIFEPFLRLPGHAEREGGVGLGLSLVRQIAQRHGGSVRCDAREGGGSCFTLRLPALPQAQAAGEPPAAPARHSG